MSHVAHMNESYCTYEWVMSQIWLCLMPVAYIALQIWLWCHVKMVSWTGIKQSHAWQIWLCKYGSDVIYGSVWCPSTTPVNVSCPMRHVAHVNEPYRTWMSHVAHMALVVAHPRHLSTSHVTRTIESRHACQWVMSRIWMNHLAHMNESYRTYESVTSHIWFRPRHLSRSHVIRINESRHTYK